MKTRTILLVGFCALAMPLLSFAQRDGHGGGGGHAGGGFGGGHATFGGGGHGGGFAPRAPAPTPHVERSVHGSLRHEDTHSFREPEIRHEEHHEEHPGVIVRGGGVPGFFTHHDVNVDVHGHQFWHDFSRGRRFDHLPGGYFSLNIGGLPYFYYGGIYYQSVPGGYEEVYPPVGAVITAPPPGSYEVIAPDGTVFYYAAGAFYQQQPDGTFALVQTPLGVVVPELPPGAVQTVVNGIVAFQFNGVFYQPVFVNGVTQYQTFVP